MEAHDGLSAAIAARAGFKGLWASGLSIACSLGYRDANEASWRELVDAVERIVDSSQLPVLVDADGGFGNFNNARLLARKLRERGAAGIALEDSCYPKVNSFVGDRHPLAGIDEFCGRLRAVKDTAAKDLILVARIEALIAGYEMHEAIARAHAYREAGADAIIIHSRSSSADQILAFTRAWQNRLPVVIVPTKYFRTPTCEYRRARISTVIWANHSVRAAAAAMRKVCGRIFAEQSAASVDSDIAPLDELFELFGYDELAKAEARYLHPDELQQ
ncbi:isocitrate lyase/phosphoenolpyruvate mutase family protein [Bradyrhizobium sp. CCBAU 53421]|uniref:isocitrate lyase/phosphoenolpyruvate mutase family protein n=1 Tax=Bradyrhizobium sp. CCBAU 53421 TaxID=1325120 RepID=UPI001FEE9BCF|nr:isocitrate lyase/phosphoenolpyruvate mutase family protein [Bradyrhizobium sp. CCBAU 53421]